MVKAAIGDYLAVEETWPGVEVERALWFVFAVARSRGAKARRRQIRGRPPFVADRYFQSVRFDEAVISLCFKVSAVICAILGAGFAGLPVLLPSFRCSDC